MEREMPGSVVSVFSEPEDFETALVQEGYLSLLVTGRGAFRARLTQVILHHLQLSAGKEQLARIAFIAVPANVVLVAFAIGKAPSPVWGGIEIRANEIITVGLGERLHARSGAPSQWGTLIIPERELLAYGCALTGTRFVIPRGIARWRPPRAAAKHLRELFDGAMRMAATRPETLADLEAAHGLEQQIIYELIECLLQVPEEESAAGKCHRDLLARFEVLLNDGSARHLTDICAELGISERLLRECCKVYFGMSPGDYRRRQAMQQVNRTLRSGKLETSTVAEIAKRHGFNGPGRFAGRYRAIYGELPSATLRSSRSVPFSVGRSRMKFL
jgi:AraC-like DNA-binding protein